MRTEWETLPSGAVIGRATDTGTMRPPSLGAIPTIAAIDAATPTGPVETQLAKYLGRKTLTGVKTVTLGTGTIIKAAAHLISDV